MYLLRDVSIAVFLMDLFSPRPSVRRITHAPAANEGSCVQIKTADHHYVTMESQRRMYFKKEIMKNAMSEQERTKTTSTQSNDYEKARKESNYLGDIAEDHHVTLLGSQSYHEQTQQFNFFNEDSSELGIEPQNERDRVITNNLLKDITNSVGRKDGNHEEVIEEIRIDIEFEKIENNEKPWTRNENEDQNMLLERDEDKIGTEIVQRQSKLQVNINRNDQEKENQKELVEEEPESGELQPTFTEIIEEKEMELIRKSLEEDDNGEEIRTTINTDENQIELENQKDKRRKIRKNYIDFVSDEEDFVWDSTSWKDTGDDTSSSETNKSKKKKKIISCDGKVGEAGLRKKKVNKRKVAKHARDKGKEYLKKDGSIAESKSLKPNPCLEVNCRNNCKEISEEKRKNIFDYFWGLPSQRKKDWLVTMTSRAPIKRKRSKESNYRSNTYNYFINDGEGRRQVCKKFMMKTLDVSQNYITYTLSNTSYGLSKEEARGKTVPKNKTPQDVKDAAIIFIKRLPAVPSHFCRKESTRLYLPTEYKNLKNIYRMYKEEHTSQGSDVVGEKVFRDIFNTAFNIGFHVPKKDKCVKCLRFEAQNREIDPKMTIHLKEKEASKKRLAFHRDLHKKNNSVLCVSFDLQKVLNTPHGESMLLFYSRKYTVYNLCFYESGTRNGYCYTWGESEGKRGADEIATILQKYIADVDSRCSVTSLILYSDSAPGQNKNKIVLAAIHNALLEAKHIETIQMNYLLPGHTEMTVDSIHATIENSVRNTIIWAPSQWPTVFQLSRKDPSPYFVATLTHKDFKNFEVFSDKYFKGNLTGKISKVRVATFKKSSPNVMSVKYSMVEDAEKYTIEIISRPKLINQKYKTVLPLTTTKYKDLKKLCDTGVIPNLFHTEYLSFTHRIGKDVLPQTDIEDVVDSD